MSPTTNFLRHTGGILLVAHFALPSCGILGGSSKDEDPSAALDRFFEEVFLARLDHSPMMRSRLGDKQDYGKWDDFSDEHAREENAMIQRDLARLQNEFDFEELDAEDQLSYRLFEVSAERSLESFRWRFHDYSINQMHGLHSEVPAFLINVHQVADEADAEAYIDRLEGMSTLFDQLVVGFQERAQRGVLPPRFVFPKVVDDCRNVISGEPFDSSGKDSALLADFRAKVTALDCSQDEESRLLEDASRAMREHVKPSYEKLIAGLEAAETTSTTDDGAWKLPDGAEYYAYALRHMTTTDLQADEIHQIGLREVERIHGEMRSIMRSTGFEGELADFFEYTRSDDRFYYPNTPEGREAYLQGAREVIAAMEAHLDELFITKPKTPMIVKAVEAYREKSAGKAFYNAGAPDGSRPGTYYANLYDMADMPIYQMEALAYHEGTPGHHMQISIARELEDIPRFRRFEFYTVYGEGWGLYTEYFPKEFGFYQDPYSDFGRLAMELWRACRLVVDTGIHDQRWSRERAIDYLMQNTPNPEGDCVKAIERYIVMPGQATAYKIGMLEILELRRRAQEALGERFDIRGFHDVILRSGSVPLDILGELVDGWIDSVPE